MLPQLHKAFTTIFTIEMVFKLGMLGPVGYFRDGYNVFDFIITLLGLLEITIHVSLVTLQIKAVACVMC